MARSVIGVLAFTLLCAAGSRAHAQTVRGQLTDSILRAPLSGAFLTLVDEHAVERARAITDQAGRYTITAPTPGTYRLRSKRIGFRPFLSRPLTLRAGETAQYDAAIDPIPIALQEVVVAGEQQCAVDSEGGNAAVAALWEEVREALARVSWTSRSPGYWYEILHFERQLTGWARPLGPDTTWLSTGYLQVPVRSAPATQLERDGYVVVGQDGWTYFAPDADVLLSDPFLRTHCFQARVGRGETEGLVGLAFAPAKGRNLPDVAGTLWIDRETAELRHLQFNYTRLPQRLAAPRAGGRLEFMRMPTGAWIVRDWVLTMPLARATRPVMGVENPPEVFGFRQSGARALAIKTATGSVVYSAEPAQPAVAAVAPAPPAPPPPLPPATPPQPPPPPVVALAPPLDTAPAGPSSRSRGSRRQDVLDEEEFSQSTAIDAYGLVQQFRPNWLRYRGPVSIQNPGAGQVLVYVNNVRWGTASRLREIPAGEVIEMRHLSGPDATTRYGKDHSGGVIQVTMR